MGKPDKAYSTLDYKLSERASHGESNLGLQTMQDGVAQKGESWPCKQSRVNSGLRNCERPYRVVWARLQTEHGM